MSQLFEGLAAVLAWFYDLTHSYGFAVILLTLAVRVVVTPLTIKGTRSMMAMQQFQPEIKRLQQEYKGDRQKLNEELMKFYRENNINPMGSCLPLLIQAPVFYVLYRVVHGITDFGADGTFSPKYLDHSSALFKSLDGSKQMLFLGIDLAKSAAGTLRGSNAIEALPYLVIIAIVTVTSYIQQKQVAGRNPSMNANPMQKNLMRLMPLGFAVFSFSFPAALGLYFVTSNVYQVGQQWYISRALYGLRRGQARAGTAIVDAESTELAEPDAGSAGRSTRDRGARGAGQLPKGQPAKGGAGSNGRAAGRDGKPAAASSRPSPSGSGKAASGKGGAGKESPTRGSQAKGASAKGGPAKAGGRNASGKQARAASGRVTEPKRATGRATPASSERSSARPAARRSGGSARRVPFGPDRPVSDDDGQNPQKKRRR
jgi:YidC/Oxa1 family membrane protein insertase